MLPLHTFIYPDCKFKAYPDHLWEFGKTLPNDWFRENVNRFIYPESLIINEAVPYCLEECPAESGVYFLIHGITIIYVGISINIQNRILQHWDKGWDIQKFWCFGGIPQIYIEDIEAFYIHRHKPYFNNKYPPLHPIVKPLLDRELNQSP